MVIYSYFLNIYFFEIVLTIPYGTKYSWLEKKKLMPHAKWKGPLRI